MPIYLKVDPGNGMPVYLQITDQIKRAVALGVLKPGEQLPTVKELARELLVNPATVSHALRELDHLEIVRSRSGHGWFVRDGVDVGAAYRDVVKTSIEAAVREARSLGVAESELRDLFSTSLEAWYRGDGTYGAR